MRQTQTGSELVIELLIEAGLSPKYAEEAVKPISPLLDRIVSCSWPLADKSRFTGRNPEFIKAINAAASNTKCDQLFWVSLTKSLQPPKPDWISANDFADVQDVYAEQIIQQLMQQMHTPFDSLIRVSDSLVAPASIMNLVDDFHANLIDLLRPAIENCVFLQFLAVSGCISLEDVMDICKNGTFELLYSYLLRRVINDQPGADQLLPTLAMLGEGILLLGLTKTTQPNHAPWLVLIA